MNATSYQIRYSTMDSYYISASTQISEWLEDLSSVERAIEGIVNLNTFSGQSATNVKNYLSDVHGLSIIALKQALIEYQSQLLLYKNGYHDIDPNIYSLLTKETMEHYYKKVNTSKSELNRLKSKIKFTLTKIDDIFVMSEPTVATLEENINYILREIDKLDDKIVDYENKKQREDLKNLNNLIDNLNKMLTTYKELNDHITGYQSGDFVKQKSVQLLAGNIQTSFDFIEEKEEEIADAYDNLTETYQQMEADYKAACDARVDTGTAEIIMGIAAATVGTLAIVCTAGMATPVVVTAVVAGGGSFLYGASNIHEGIEEVKYGLNGDLDSESWNPIRDTVFCGNEMAYNTWGSLSMSVAGICVPVGRAINTVAGVATGKEIAKTVMITVAKEKIKDGLAESGTRLIVNKVDERFNLNQTENVLLSGGLNIAFNSGLDKAEVRAGLGNNSFATGMSYDDAVVYNKWTDGCINGTNNNHPRMSDIDLKKWDLANARLDESIAISKVDTDIYSQLKAVEYNRNVNFFDTTTKTDIGGDVFGVKGSSDTLKASNSAGKLLDSMEVEEHAFNAIKGGNKSDLVILGKYEEGSLVSYDAVAKDMDAQYFDLENWDELSSKHSPGEIWRINERFLDIQTSSGREIYLSHSPAEYINKGSFYSKEIRYLVDAGYRFVKEGDLWHAIR